MCGFVSCVLQELNRLGSVLASEGALPRLSSLLGGHEMIRGAPVRYHGRPGESVVEREVRDGSRGCPQQGYGHCGGVVGRGAGETEAVAAIFPAESTLQGLEVVEANDDVLADVGDQTAHRWQ